MLLSNVNIGTGPSAGDGDPLRTAFNTINNNFTKIQSNVNALTNSVSSVAGRTGNVTLTTQDIIGINNYATTSYVDSKLSANIANIQANITLIQSDINTLYGNAGVQSSTLATLTSNAAAQAGSLTTLTANAASQAGELTTLLSNASVQAGEIASLLSNAGSQHEAISSLQSNAAVQAGAIATLTSNAAVQAGAIADLVANAAAQAGLIANAAGTYSNSNVASYLTTYGGNVSVGNIIFDDLSVQTTAYTGTQWRSNLISSLTSKPSWLSYYPGLKNQEGTQYGFDAGGMFFTSNSDNDFAYPIQTNLHFHETDVLEVVTTIYFGATNNDQGLCIFPADTRPIWKGGVDTSRIAFQYTSGIPVLYGQTTANTAPGSPILTAGNYYTIKFIYNPANTITVETFSGNTATGSAIDSRTLNEVLPAGDYRIGFDADNDAAGIKSYFKTLTVRTLTNTVVNDLEIQGQITGNLIPSANVTYSLGSIDRQWKDLFVSNNTIFIGGIPLSVDAGGNLLVNGNAVSGGSGTATGITSDTTITVTNADSNADISLLSGDDITLQGKDKTTSDSEGGDIFIYAGNGGDADLDDAGGSGGDISIEAGTGGAPSVAYNGGLGGTLDLYGGSGGGADPEYNRAARDGGRARLRAGSAGFNGGNVAFGALGGPVEITAGQTTLANAIGGTVIITSGQGGSGALAGNVEINTPSSDLGSGGTWTFDGYGALTLPASGTIKAPNAQEFQLQAKDANSVLRNEINLDPNNGTYMSVWSDETTSFSSADWGSGSWNNESGLGAARFTDAQALQDFWTTGIGSLGLAYEASINGGPRTPNVFYDGNNGETYGVYLGLDAVPPGGQGTTVPITSLVFYYRTQSKINMDVDGGEILLDGQALNINLQTTNGINLQSGQVLDIKNIGQQPVRIFTDNTTHTWEFDSGGSLTLPREGRITGIGLGVASDRTGYISWAGNTSGDGSGFNTMRLVPDSLGLEDADQYIIIDPTAGEPGHIHIRAGGTQDASGADLYLGGELTFVRVSDNYDTVTIRTTNIGDPNITMDWIFDNQGYLSLPGIGNNRIGESEPGLVLTSDNSIVLQSNNGGNINQIQEWTFGADGTLTLPSSSTIKEVAAPIVGNAILLTPSGGNETTQALKIYPTEGGDGDHVHLTANGGTTELYLGNDNHYVKLVNGGNVEIRTDDMAANTAVWSFGTDGNLTVAGAVKAQNVPAVGNMAVAGEPSFSYNGTTLAIFDPMDFSVGALADVQPGWTVSNGAGFSDTVLSINDPAPGSITTTSVYWPTMGGQTYTFTSPGYAPASTNDLKLSSGSNVSIAANSQMWTFGMSGIYGVLTLPGEGIIRSLNDTINLTSLNTTSGYANIVYLGSGGGLGFTDQAIGGNWLEIFRSGATPEIKAPTGNLLITTVITGVSSNTWTYGTDGSITFPDTTVQTTAWTGSAPEIDITDTNGLTTIYYPTFVENRTTGQIARADTNLTYRTDDNILGVGNIAIGASGNITFPDSTVQTTAWTGFTANTANWSNPAPSTLNDAIDRLAILVKTLNSGTGA